MARKIVRGELEYKTKIPNLYVGYWPCSIFCLGIYLTPFTTIFEIITTFSNRWILDPLIRIYRTIRYKDSVLAFMSKDLVSTELESRDRMLQKTSYNLVLRQYEDEIQSPIKSAILGDLIHNILIQAQCAKVDLVLAMSALDQLLQANEVNFALLAIVPSIFSLFWFFGFMREIIQNKGTLIFQKNKSSLVEIMWKMQFLFECLEDNELKHGLIIIECYKALILSKKISKTLNSALKLEFNEILKGNFNALNRMRLLLK